jgi:DNA-directed RNA polymerase subunit RPC12/RpoP
MLQTQPPHSSLVHSLPGYLKIPSKLTRYLAEDSIDDPWFMAEPASAPDTDGPTRPFRKPVHPTKAGTEGSHSDTYDFEDSERPGKRQRLNPVPMTAAAAQAEAQRSKQSPPSTQTSPNPSLQALSNLMSGSKNEMSKADTNANPTTAVSAPMAVVAENIQPASTSSVTGEGVEQTSPVSMSSIGTLESFAGPSGMTTTVGSPLPIDETGRQASGTADASSTSPDDANKSFSYAGSAATLGIPALHEAKRGVSLPGSMSRQGTRSPSSKKHKCPYCATEFTRHHNLKSHLLTHSQEKPYVCSNCGSRFRRLHDLKRHTKLHTGERNHACPKCGRKFARGDALARHNKGPGGCAGRRASMGSFGEGEEFDGDDPMDSVMYNEPESMEDEDGNDKRPGIRRQAPSGDDTTDDPENGSRMPSTYPPIQGRPPGGIASGNFPPRGGFGPSGSGSSSSAQPSLPFPQLSGSAGSSRHPGMGGPFAQNLAQNPLTESPKPLSPGQSQRGSLAGDGSLNRHRSPSMTHFPTPNASFPRSAGGSGSSLGIPAQLPPPVPGLNPPDARFTLHSQGPTHPPTQPTGPPTHVGSGPLSSQSNSLSSGHAASGHGSGDVTSPFLPKDDRIWAYVKSLEQRIGSMEAEITSLKSQLAGRM